MRKLLTLLALCTAANVAVAQTTMNIYQSNGSVLQIPISTIDSITYTVNPLGSPATVTTQAISGLTTTSAECGGNVSDEGDSPVTQRGVCFRTSPNPTISNSITVDGAGAGSFTSELMGLIPNTTYYVRAYAVNSAGISYGNEVSFNTISGIVAMSTTAASNVDFHSVVTGGNITSDGGDDIYVRGICWSTSPNPTTNDDYDASGSGIGSFSVTLTGLLAGTVYYARAYAMNSTGIYYGNEVNFITSAYFISGGGVSDISGNSYSTIVMGNGQEWMAENLRATNYANGDPIPNVTDGNSWYGLTSGAWSHYENNVSHDVVFGKLYIGYTVEDSRGLCPLGWHVPNEDEHDALIVYLGGIEVAGARMKSTGELASGNGLWSGMNEGATNESGFSGHPGGTRSSDPNASFMAMGQVGWWWLSTLSDGLQAFLLQNNSTSSTVQEGVPLSLGCYVRCLKD